MQNNHLSSLLTLLFCPPVPSAPFGSWAWSGYLHWFVRMSASHQDLNCDTRCFTKEIKDKLNTTGYTRLNKYGHRVINVSPCHYHFPSLCVWGMHTRVFLHRSRAEWPGSYDVQSSAGFVTSLNKSEGIRGDATGFKWVFHIFVVNIASSVG